MLAEPAVAEACALLSASTLAGAEVRPLLEVALERVTRAGVTFCVPGASVSVCLAGVTVLEGAVAVLLDGVAAVLREVLVVAVLPEAVFLAEVPVVLLLVDELPEPVFTCLLAVLPLEAEVLLLVDPVLLEAEALEDALRDV